MSTHEHGAQSGSKALGPTPLLSGAANQAKQLKSRFNSWERFCEAHPQARVAIAVQSGYSHEIKFFCHSIVFWEEFKDFFTERCAAAGSRSERSRLKGELGKAGIDFSKFLALAIDLWKAEGVISQLQADVMIKLATGTAFDTDGCAALTAVGARRKVAGTARPTSTVAPTRTTPATSHEADDEPGDFTSPLRQAAVNPGRAQQGRSAEPAQQQPPSQQQERGAERAQRGAAAQQQEQTAERAQRGAAAQQQEQTAERAQRGAAAQQQERGAEPAQRGAAAQQQATMDEEEAGTAATVEEAEQEASDSSELPITRRLSQKRSRQRLDDDSDDEPSTAAAVAASYPANKRARRTRNPTEKMAESLQQATQLSPEQTKNAVQRRVFGTGGLIKECHEGVLRDLIEAEHSQRWDPEKQQLRLPKTSAGEVGYADAVCKAMGEHFPDLRGKLTATDIGNAKTRFWRDTSGKCPHEVNSAKAAAAAAEQQQAEQQAAAEALSGIPAATATWDEVEPFLEFVQQDMDANRIGTWRADNMRRAKAVEHLCRLWESSLAFTKEQRRRIRDFCIEFKVKLST